MLCIMWAYFMFELVGESRASCHHAGLCVYGTLGPCVCLMSFLQF
jgi:hypothetical protein